MQSHEVYKYNSVDTCRDTYMEVPDELQTISSEYFRDHECIEKKKAISHWFRSPRL